MEDVGNDLARERGYSQGPVWCLEEAIKVEDDVWNDIDFRAKATIILCLSDGVLYNVMNEETTAGLWCRLESLS